MEREHFLTPRCWAVALGKPAFRPDYQSTTAVGFFVCTGGCTPIRTRAAQLWASDRGCEISCCLLYFTA